MKKLLGLLFITLIFLSACGRPDSGTTTTEEGETGEDTYTIRLAHLVPEEQSSHIAAVAIRIQFNR